MGIFTVKLKFILKVHCFTLTKNNCQFETMTAHICSNHQEPNYCIENYKDKQIA